MDQVDVRLNALLERGRDLRRLLRATESDAERLRSQYLEVADQIVVLESLRTGILVDYDAEAKNRGLAIRPEIATPVNGNGAAPRKLNIDASNEHAVTASSQAGGRKKPAKGKPGLKRKRPSARRAPADAAESAPAADPEPISSGLVRAGSEQERALLFVAEQGSVTVDELAFALGKQKPTAGQLLLELKRKGLVEPLTRGEWETSSKGDAEVRRVKGAAPLATGETEEPETDD
jgi:DNA-binding transcriptional ArsR family regulator